MKLVLFIYSLMICASAIFAADTDLDKMLAEADVEFLESEIEFLKEFTKEFGFQTNWIIQIRPESDRTYPIHGKYYIISERHPAQQVDEIVKQMKTLFSLYLSLNSNATGFDNVLIAAGSQELGKKRVSILRPGALFSIFAAVKKFWLNNILDEADKEFLKPDIELLKKFTEEFGFKTDWTIHIRNESDVSYPTHGRYYIISERHQAQQVDEIVKQIKDRLSFYVSLSSNTTALDNVLIAADSQQLGKKRVSISKPWALFSVLEKFQRVQKSWKSRPMSTKYQIEACSVPLSEIISKEFNPMISMVEFEHFFVRGKIDNNYSCLNFEPENMTFAFNPQNLITTIIQGTKASIGRQNYEKSKCFPIFGTNDSAEFEARWKEITNRYDEKAQKYNYNLLLGQHCRRMTKEVLLELGIPMPAELNHKFLAQETYEESLRKNGSKR